MSFCSDVKEELCKIDNTNDTCAAELCGMLLFAQSVSAEQLKISTENVFVINRLQQLSAKLLGVFFEMSEIGVTYTASVQTKAVTDLLDKFSVETDFSFNVGQFESSKMLYAFLRGAVLSGGYFIDPMNRYHFELVTENFATAWCMVELLNSHKIPAKMIERRTSHVIYLKDSQQIYNLLYKLGARNAAFSFMDIKIEKETNNNNNRMDNCVAYNMDKALNKAVEQIRAIDLIASTVGLSSLSEDLQEVALLRKDNPTSSLNELVNICEGRLSKASISRRLNKIIEISKSIKGS